MKAEDVPQTDIDPPVVSGGLVYVRDGNGDPWLIALGLHGTRATADGEMPNSLLIPIADIPRPLTVTKVTVIDYA